MKLLIVVISIILICLHLTVVTNANIDPHQRRVSAIHQRMTAVQSSSREGNPRPITWESNKISTIDRTIKSLHRFRRVRRTVTPYPKHHLLQPIEVPLDEVAPKEGLNSTTAPYTDNHHSWKKAPVILQQG